MGKNYIIIILFIGLIVSLLFPRERVEYETITYTDTIIDVVISDPIFIEKPVYYPQDIDTLKVIEDYFTRKGYQQQLPIGDLGYVDVNFTLSQNTLQELNYSYKLDIKQPKIYKNSISLQTNLNTYLISYDRRLNSRFDISTTYIVPHNQLLIGLKYNF